MDRSGSLESKRGHRVSPGVPGTEAGPPVYLGESEQEQGAQPGPLKSTASPQPLETRARAGPLHPAAGPQGRQEDGAGIDLLENEFQIIKMAGKTLTQVLVVSIKYITIC